MLSGIQSYITAPPAGVLPVAVISLDDHGARRSGIRDKGLPGEWAENYWPATDFRNADHAAMAGNTCLATLETHLGRKLRPGEVGCALSHHNVACWLAESPHDLMLVLEDDTVPLAPAFEQSVLSAATTLQPYARTGAAFVCLLSLEMKFVRHACKRQVRSRSRQRTSQGPELFLHSDPDVRIWRAHAYLISRGAATRTRMRETRILALADDWHHRRSLGLIDRIFYSAPVIFGLHGELESSIDAEGARQQAGPPEHPSGPPARTGPGLPGPSRLFSKVRRRGRRALARLLSPFPFYV